MPPSLIEIDDRWVDVDFEREVKENPLLVEQGVGLQMINSMMPPGWCMDDNVYEASDRMMTDSECFEAFERQEEEKNGASWLVSRIYDQDGEGACVGNGFCQAHEIRQAFQFGLENVIHLSAMSLYQQIGSSAQSGAMVSDGIRKMQDVGVLPWDTPENRKIFGDQVMPNIGWRTKRPAGAEKTMALFRGFESRIIRSVNGLYNALARRIPVVVGRQGHCIVYSGGCMRNGQVRIPYPNSWKITWGQAYGNMEGGFGFDTAAQVRMSAGYAVAVTGVRAPFINRRIAAAETLHNLAV